jgi:hypothetical protein
MSETNEKKYKQLALFSVIVAEVVVTPSVTGGIAYFLLKNNSLQKVGTAVGALVGLIVAFYRIYLLHQKQNRE